MKKTAAFFIILVLIIVSALFLLGVKNTNAVARSSGIPSKAFSLNLDDTLDNLLRYNVEACSDGSFVITIGPNILDGTYYYHYRPDLSRQKYDFFQGFRWAGDIKAASIGGHNCVEAPVSLYCSGEPVLTVRGKYRPENDWKLSDYDVVFLKEEDRAFHEMYSALNWEQREAYKQNERFSNAMPYEEQIRALKNAFYCGSFHVAKIIYDMQKADQESNALFELAVMKDFKLTDFQKDNPYLPKPVFENKNVSFPAPEALSMFAEAVSAYGNRYPESSNVESNTDYKCLQGLPNAKDFFPDYQLEDDDTRLWGAYDIDFDNDGLNELVYFYPGGTVGNEFWDIIHLDESGDITSVASGESWRSLSMHQYKGKYFFFSWEHDYNDGEELGINMFAMAEDGRLWHASILREMTGAGIVFSDIFDESIKPLAEDIEQEFQEYIAEYKNASEGQWGKTCNPSRTVRDKIGNQAVAMPDVYYELDVNNDGTDEVLAESVFYPGSRHQLYLYQLISYDRKTGRALDLSRMFASAGSYSYCQRIFLIPYEGKNFFLSMQGNQGSSYIFKLQEVAGDKPRALACWFVTVIQQVRVSEEVYRSEP